MNFNYQCSGCGREYNITPDIMVCPECSKMQEPDKPLRGILKVVLNGRTDKKLSDDVFIGPNSVVIDKAENRLHAHKAIMAMIIGGRL